MTNCGVHGEPFFGCTTANARRRESERCQASPNCCGAAKEKGRCQTHADQLSAAIKRNRAHYSKEVTI